MIAKIVSGSSFGGCTAYAYGKDEAEVIAYEGIIPDNPKIAAKCFEAQAQMNERVMKPVGHISISFKPEDRQYLTNKFMAHLVKEYMEKMGIVNTQYVVLRHHNTPNPHCHLIFNRVDNNGKRISDSKERVRSINICKYMKLDYGLTFGMDKSKTRKEKLRSSEKVRYKLASEVKIALGVSSNWEEFSKRLTSCGIKAEICFRSGTTIPQGICFTKYGTTFKGSSLDRSLSFTKLDKTLSGEINVDWNVLEQSQSQTQKAQESQSSEQKVMANLVGIASDLVAGMLDVGQGGRSEEQDMKPRKKKGMRL